MSRIKDIAEYVKLSPATVSMVLNNRPGFSEETRTKVLEAAKELGYRPVTARRAVPETGENLPFVICKRHGEVVAETPFFSSLIEALENEAKSNGYHLSIHYLQQETMAQGLQQLAMGTDNGLLLLATEMTREDGALLASLRVPYVLLDNAMMGVSADKVQIANRQGAYLAVEELVRCGHRNIGYLHSSVWISNFEERREGFLLAMRDHGLPVREEWIACIGSTHETAYRDMLAYCAHRPDMPTAFFADNDILAMGALKALQEQKYRVPEDISLIGFDDMPYCTMLTPNLSTMRVSTQHMGRAAVKLLLERNDFRQKIEVETALVRRESIRVLSAR